MSKCYYAESRCAEYPYIMHAAISEVQNSAQGLSCPLSLSMLGPKGNTNILIQTHSPSHPYTDK